jgi:hypothetical protein
MALQISSALEAAGYRLLSRTGAILLGSYVVLMAGLISVSNTMVVRVYERAGLTEVANAVPLLLDVPLSVAVGGYLLLTLVSTYFSIVAIRTFVAGSQDAFPDDAFTRNVPLAMVNIIVGGIVYGLLVFLGTVALVVPGIIAYVAFIFMLPYIAVEDRNFVDALRASYRLSKGNWLLLFVLLVILIALAGVVGGIGGFVSSLLLPQTLGQLSLTLVQAPISLYLLAVIAAAFTQLRDDTGSLSGSSPTAQSSSTAI